MHLSFHPGCLFLHIGIQSGQILCLVVGSIRHLGHSSSRRLLVVHDVRGEVAQMRAIALHGRLSPGVLFPSLSRCLFLLGFNIFVLDQDYVLAFRLVLRKHHSLVTGCDDLESVARARIEVQWL
jgi:hypothetical protein